MTIRLPTWSALSLGPLALAGCLLPTSVPLGRNLPHHDPGDPAPLVDIDGDGQTEAEGDCDDGDQSVGAGFEEKCDDKDNDCDTVVDAGPDGVDVCYESDTFQQALKTDVLLVMDHSYDMSQYWWPAAQGATAMTAQLVGDTSDTRIGLLFNDLQNEKYDGNLVVPPGFDGRWLEGDDKRMDPHFVRNFFSRTLLYEQGQDPEGAQGIRGAVEAAIASESHSRAFFRRDASLNLVIVTNEDDKSGPDNNTFLDDLADVVGSVSDVRVSAITETGDYPCPGAPSASYEPATSILELVQQTGGWSDSLCKGDWTGFLTAVGQSIANSALRTTFHLGMPARQGTVRVTIQPNDHSEPYPWTTFALIDSQTLVFQAAPPPIGTTILVEYEQEWRF